MTPSAAGRRARAKARLRLKELEAELKRIRALVLSTLPPCDCCDVAPKLTAEELQDKLLEWCEGKWETTRE